VGTLLYVSNDGNFLVSAQHCVHWIKQQNDLQHITQWGRNLS